MINFLNYNSHFSYTTNVIDSTSDILWKNNHKKFASRNRTSFRIPTFNTLFRCLQEKRILSYKQRDTTIDFLRSQITYCDEILEYVLSTKKPLSESLSDYGISHFEMMEFATEELLKRIRKAKSEDKIF